MRVFKSIENDICRLFIRVDLLLRLIGARIFLIGRLSLQWVCGNDRVSRIKFPSSVHIGDFRRDFREKGKADTESAVAARTKGSFGNISHLLGDWWKDGVNHCCP